MRQLTIELADRTPRGRIKPVTTSRHGHEKLSWGEPRREATVELLQLFDDSISAKGIDVTKRAAAKGWEANSKHRTYIPVTR